MPPGEELRDAHQRVLRQEIAPGKPEDSWRVVRQLPTAPWDFVGRQTERDALISAAGVPDGQVGVPVAVVCGQPGVGKTTLALYAAHKLSERFPDGQLWVQLAGASERPRDPGEVLGEMLRGLGVPGSAIPDGYSERSRALRSALAERKVLVVADDAASVAQVEPLLPGTPGCALIVTSRMHLAGLAGARYVPLGVLPR
jgi:Mrp family chromosome partitioning ATPase